MLATKPCSGWGWCRYRHHGLLIASVAGREADQSLDDLDLPRIKCIRCRRCAHSSRHTRESGDPVAAWAPLSPGMAKRTADLVATGTVNSRQTLRPRREQAECTDGMNFPDCANDTHADAARDHPGPRGSFPGDQRGAAASKREVPCSGHSFCRADGCPGRFPARR